MRYEIAQYLCPVICFTLCELAKWRHELAQRGLMEYQYHLGMMYFKGRGVTKDVAEAAYWFRKAAKQGAAGAQFVLGGILLHDPDDGRGKDVARAVKWLLKAARQGNEEAFRTLEKLGFE